MFSLSARILVLCLLIACNASLALANNAGEYEIKAAFLYKFAQFTEWPGPVPDPFTICVLGDNPFADALQNLNGKKINKAVVVTQHPGSLDEAKSCQVLFLNPANIYQLKQWQAGLQGLPILTVSDEPAAWDYDILIVLSTEANRVSFNINRSAAHKVGIEFRSQFLQLARMLR